MKYAVYFLVFVLVISGAYCAGYRVGSAEKHVEFITKTVEVIKYVEREKAEIQSRPNASRDELLKLMHNSQL